MANKKDLEKDQTRYGTYKIPSSKQVIGNDYRKPSPTTGDGYNKAAKTNIAGGKIYPINTDKDILEQGFPKYKRGDNYDSIGNKLNTLEKRKGQYNEDVYSFDLGYEHIKPTEYKYTGERFEAFNTDKDILDQGFPKYKYGDKYDSIADEYNDIVAARLAKKLGKSVGQLTKDDWDNRAKELFKTTPLKSYTPSNKKLDKTVGELTGYDVNTDPGLKAVMQSSNLYDRSSIPWYDKFNRFGIIDPYNSLSGTKEYLFFTKPDLHICTPGTDTLNPQLANNSFFYELAMRYPQVISQLQKSMKPFDGTNTNPFMAVLSNSVKNKLELPEMSTTEIDTSATIFGTSIDYRGDAFSSNEKHEFSLEFEDTKYLELYHLFRAYEEYEELKKIGIVSPPNINKFPEDKAGYSYNQYLSNKELHDQFAIYKFVVDSDYEELIYYAVCQGVYFKTVPREAFSDIDATNGLRYNVQMKAQFIDDMKPYILTDFDALVRESMGLGGMKDAEWLDIYNDKIGATDGRWAVAPYIVKQQRDDTDAKAWLAPTTMKYKYKLKWRLA